MAKLEARLLFVEGIGKMNLGRWSQADIVDAQIRIQRYVELHGHTEATEEAWKYLDRRYAKIEKTYSIKKKERRRKVAV